MEGTHRADRGYVVGTVNVVSRFSKHDSDTAKRNFLRPDDDEVVQPSPPLRTKLYMIFMYICIHVEYIYLR